MNERQTRRLAEMKLLEVVNSNCLSCFISTNGFIDLVNPNLEEFEFLILFKISNSMVVSCLLLIQKKMIA